MYSNLVSSSIFRIFSRASFHNFHFHSSSCSAFLPESPTCIHPRLKCWKRNHERQQANKQTEREIGQNWIFYFIHINFLINYGHSLLFNSLYRQFGVVKQFISSYSIYDDLLKVWHWIIFSGALLNLSSMSLLSSFTIFQFINHPHLIKFWLDLLWHSFWKGGRKMRIVSLMPAELSRLFSLALNVISVVLQNIKLSYRLKIVGVSDCFYGSISRIHSTPSSSALSLHQHTSFDFPLTLSLPFNFLTSYFCYVCVCMRSRARSWLRVWVWVFPLIWLLRAKSHFYMLHKSDREMLEH